MTRLDGAFVTAPGALAPIALITIAACSLPLAGCSASNATAAPVVTKPVAAAPPPKDDGKPSEGGGGGDGHAAALEEMKVAPFQARDDKQHSVRVPLPDARSWTRVKFWGVQSLVGFRYGKEHHGIVGASVTHVDDPTVPGACRQSFEEWAKPMIAAFDVDIEHEAPDAFVWNNQIVEVSSMYARMATLLKKDEFAVTFAAYPMPQWKDPTTGKGACLIVGMAVPARGEATRAKAVRDRFAKEALPKVVATAKTEPPDRF